nr:substrate-binding domain-containing protein [Shewanella sp. 10N.286.48.B5]PMH84739.1 hypothetical protein BCU57_16880 [Shewanella sp. 10N.286.48.B5]
MADSPQVLDFLDKSETPYVRVAPDKELERAPYIGINEYCATFEMTTSLIELGHKRIGFVRGDSQQKSSQLRFKGYMDALRSAQIDLDSAIILDGDYTYDSGLAAAEIMLALKDKPTAIVASNDDMAAGVIAVAQRRGIDVPEQLSVTGFDDSLIARLVYPKLTTVRQPLAAITEKAITILIEPPLAYSKLKKTHSRYILDYALIDRDSVKAPNEDNKNWAAG